MASTHASTERRRNHWEKRDKNGTFQYLKHVSWANRATCKRTPGKYLTLQFLWNLTILRAYIAADHTFPVAVMMFTASRKHLFENFPCSWGYLVNFITCLHSEHDWQFYAGIQTKVATCNSHNRDYEKTPLLLKAFVKSTNKTSIYGQK